MKRTIIATIIVVILAFTMITPALANITVGSVIPFDGTNIVGGDGSVRAANIQGQRLSILAPTGINLDFVVDPFNLLNLTVGADFDPNAANPIITFRGDQTLRYINNSSVPVILDVRATVSGTAATHAQLLATDVQTGTNQRSMFWMVPNTTAVRTQTQVFTGHNQCLPFGNSTQNQNRPTKFLLAERPHKLVVQSLGNTTTPAEITRVPVNPGELGFGTAIALGGMINTGATWPSGAGALRVDLAFSAVERTGTGAPVSIAGVYGLLGAQTIGGTPHPAPVLAAIPQGGGFRLVAAEFPQVGSTPVTQFQGQVGTANVVVRVLGIPDNATINTVTANTFLLVAGSSTGQHYTVGSGANNNGNVITFIASRGWPNAHRTGTAGGDTLTIAYTPSGGTQQTAVISGLTFLAG